MAQVDSLDKYREDGSLNYGPAMFVTSYIIIVVWVLLQASWAPPGPPLHPSAPPLASLGPSVSPPSLTSLSPPSSCQVSVAVLLDNFVNHTIKVEEEEKRKSQAEQRSRAEARVFGGPGRGAVS